MTLALATDDPNSIAETYVRQHMRLICPGDTVGIGFSNPTTGQSIPVFFVRNRLQGLAGKVETLATRLRTGYGAALTRREEAQLETFVDKHGVKAVLAEFGTIGVSLRAFCRRKGLPLFVNFHGHDATVLARRADVRSAYRLLARDCAGVICGSRHFSKILKKLGFPADMIAVIPCGIELMEFSPGGEKDADLVVAIGRLTRKKRPDLSIRAFAKAHAEHQSLRLEIIGEGDQRPVCEALIAELKLDDAVTLRGAQPHDEVKATLRRAGIFIQHCITSENGDQESQGISLLEAMASGVPVATTDHNGFSETVLEGVTGFLSPEGDVDAMAKNIMRLVEDQALAKRLGQAGRARVEACFDAEMLSVRLRSLMFGADGCRAIDHRLQVTQ